LAYAIVTYFWKAYIVGFTGIVELQPGAIGLGDRVLMKQRFVLQKGIASPEPMIEYHPESIHRRHTGVEIFVCAIAEINGIKNA
jgi:hypothetical protein